MSKFIWKILDVIKISAPLTLLTKSSLKEDGWFKSYYSKQAIDAKGNPIPWCTYSFIKFIEPRLLNTFDVFEYGCGNSSLWYAKRVRSIKSVENDEKWFNNISSRLPVNAKAVLQTDINDGDYSKEVLKDGKKYQIIIIDGRDRNNCVKYSLQQLADDGIIVYDNTQVPEYLPSIQILLNTGFKKIDFIGNLPIVPHNNTTTIFYREKNCLLI